MQAIRRVLVAVKEPAARSKPAAAKAAQTVVTEIAGPLRGLRVMRGREPECADHYRAATDRRGEQARDSPA